MDLDPSPADSDTWYPAQSSNAFENTTSSEPPDPLTELAVHHKEKKRADGEFMG
jgi:hypothetical protein